MLYGDKLPALKGTIDVRLVSVGPACLERSKRRSHPRRVSSDVLFRVSRASCSMYDLLIKAGTIVDGSGNPAFTGDVAIEGGRIVEGGRAEGGARRTLDAHRLIVTPRFV